jgi:uncharacterized protein (DUF1778 family)
MPRGFEFQPGMNVRQAQSSWRFAGPIVRYCDVTQARIWFCARREIDESVLQRDSRITWNGKPIPCSIRLQQIKPSQNLIFYVCTFIFPSTLQEAANAQDLQIEYRIKPFDSIDSSINGHILIAKKGRPSRILASSCFKIHGSGKAPGAISYDQPHVLFLVGDQIYADDVSEAAFSDRQNLAAVIAAQGNSLTTDKRERGRIIQDSGLTADIGGKGSANNKNHCLTFWEYSALYILYWNTSFWSNALKRECPAGYEASLYLSEVLFPQLSTYMLFDDHDITDDWNVDLKWISRGLDDDTLAEIICNGLSAFVLFQAWGNTAIDSIQDQRIVNLGETIATAYLKSDDDSADKWKKLKAAITESSFSFTTPTVPPACWLDCRTQRKAAQIMARRYWLPSEHFTRLWRVPSISTLTAKCASDTLLFDSRDFEKMLKAVDSPSVIVVTGTPVLAPRYVVQANTLIPLLVEAVTPSRVLPIDRLALERLRIDKDLEHFESNPQSFVEFWRTVAAANISEVSLLSGDLHVSQIRQASVRVVDSFGTDKVIAVVQATVSPMLNGLDAEPGNSPNTVQVNSTARGISSAIQALAAVAAKPSLLLMYLGSDSLSGYMLQSESSGIVTCGELLAAPERAYVDRGLFSDRDLLILWHSAAQGKGESDEKFIFCSSLLAFEINKGSFGFTFYNPDGSYSSLTKLSRH